MQYSKGTCSNCKKEDVWIVNRSRRLCLYCNNERLAVGRKPKKRIVPNRYNKKFNYDTRWGFTSELEMFRWIVETRGGCSEVSGEPILYPEPWHFAHVLAKALNKFPHFRLNPDNVILMTREEHTDFDNMTKEDCIKKHPHIEWVYDKEIELKAIYKEMFG